MSEQMFVSYCEEYCPPDGSIEEFYPYVTNMLYVHRTRENARKYIGEYAKWLIDFYNVAYKERGKFSFYYDDDDPDAVYILNEDNEETIHVVSFEEVTIRDENAG